MKRILTCAGLAAVGAVSLQAQSAGDAQPAKPWNVSANVRGFYDDNYLTAPSNRSDGGVTKEGSWGAAVGASVGYDIVSDVTTLASKLAYDGRWYAARDEDTIDHSILFDLDLKHSFSERYKLDVKDSFVYSIEPMLLAPDNAPSATFLRASGTGYRNNGRIDFTAGMTEKFSVDLFYSNGLYQYEDDGTSTWSAVLDRMENTPGVDLRYQVQPSTSALVGYKYSWVDYTSDSKLYSPTDPSPYNDPSIRNNTSHFAYVGGEHNFNTRLTAQAKVGIQITEFTNVPEPADDSSVGPYADASIGYQYSEGSRIVLGVIHARTPTDVATYSGQLPSGENPTTLDTSATTTYLAVVHRITAKLIATGRAQWQMSEFNGGTVDGESDNYYALEANLAYELTKYVFAEAGYSFDRLDSDLENRSFSRNRVWLGFRGSF